MKIYSLIQEDDEIILAINQRWGLNWPITVWQLFLDNSWHSCVEHKKMYFRWIFTLKKKFILGLLLLLLCCHQFSIQCVVIFKLLSMCSLIVFLPIIFGLYFLVALIQVVGIQVYRGKESLLVMQINLTMFLISSSFLYLQKFFGIFTDMNEEVFQNIKKELTGFILKLSFFNIMSRLSIVLKIPKDHFMILIKEDTMIIYNDGIQLAYFFDTYSNMLNQEEREASRQSTKEIGIDIQKVNGPYKRKGKRQAQTGKLPLTLLQVEILLLVLFIQINQNATTILLVHRTSLSCEMVSFC